MKDVVFVTGNQSKADYLAKFLGHDIERVDVDVVEIQSLDMREVVKFKMRAAYDQVRRPVLVEDCGIECTALGGLPGTFTKFFEKTIGLEGECRLLDGKDRGAIVRCVYGYFDGTTETYFAGSMKGTVPEHPTGTGGFGFDPIFIPEGYTITRAQMSRDDDEKTYLIFKPLAQVRAFLKS